MRKSSSCLPIAAEDNKEEMAMIFIGCENLTALGGGDKHLFLARTEEDALFWTTKSGERLEFQTLEEAEEYLARHQSSLPDPEAVTSDPEVKVHH